MDWATQRKMGCFAVIVMIILALASWFVYQNFLKVEPTCSDGKQNQNERGIDCGGICTKVCLFDAKTIVPLWSRVFPTASGVHSVVSYVENQNPTAGVQKISYEFRVYDDQNILAGEPITGTTFIAPNERTAIYYSPVQTGNRIPATAFFKFTSTPEWFITDKRFTQPLLKSANSSLTEVGIAPKLSVDIVNDSLYDYKDVEVVAILYGEKGNAINASSTYIDFIEQQSTQKVYFTWPQAFSGPVTRIEIIPRINPFTQPK